MLKKDFPDEKILMYIREQGRLETEQREREAKSDIKNGFAYINGEREVFATARMPELKISMIMPEDFNRRSESAIGAACGEAAQPQAILFSNHDKTISIKLHALPSETGVQMEDILQNEVARLKSSLINITDEGNAQNEQEKEIRFFEASASTDGNEIFSVIFLFAAESAVIKGIIDCVDYRLSDWKDAMLQMMRSIIDDTP